MGGFFGGLIAGAITVLALGAVVSLTAPLTRKPEIATTAPEVSATPEPVIAGNVDDSGADADLVELPPHAPDAPEAQTDTLDGLGSAGLETDVPPETSVSPDSPEAPTVTATLSDSPAIDAPAALPVPIPAPTSPEQEVAPEVVTDTPPAPEPAPVGETPPLDQEVAVVVPDQPEPQVEPQENPIAVEGEEDTQPRQQPRVLTLPSVETDQPTSSGTLAGKRVVPLHERDDEPAQEAAVAVVTPANPIEDFAATFENPEAKPLMSIILIDEAGAYGAEALKDFPYPLSFAVSPSDPEASEKMARHREAGFEVLALADLPEAASAQDAEVSLSVWLDALPETVGILEGVESGIHGNRKLADQVAAIAAGTGRGLVTQDNGLNTVQKLAARNGVPSSVVFRDFDGARQDAKIMRRFLDQAAFRAGQEGAVVMMGRLRPETISALLLWGLEDRSNRVAMAPISAVMMKQIR